MELLKEIYRTEGLNPHGKALNREAVRGITFMDKKLLLVYSPTNGCYKFPGGGIKHGENHLEALNREIKEECGVLLTGINGAFGQIVEYGIPKEFDYDVFCQTSYYYLCTVDPKFRGQNLDEYEFELGLRPEWVDVNFALQKNHLALTGYYGEPPFWATRETYMLGLLAERRIDKWGVSL